VNRLAFALVALFPFGLAAEEIPAEIAAWKAFCASIEQAGVEILERYPQPHEIDRAEAPLFLAQQLGMAVQAVLARRDRAFPLLRIGATTLNKMGLDGADAKYSGASIVGDGTYRLHGKLGNARLIALQAVAKGPPYQGFGGLSGDDLGADSAGRFEVMLAPERPPGWEGPWLATDPRATDLLVREYFGDWRNESPSDMRLERVDVAEVPAPMTSAESARLLELATQEFAGRAPIWQPRVQQVRKQLRNQLSPATQTGQGLASNFYGRGWFALAPDEAMLIEIDAPDALLWSFQLGNFWWESLDYINRTGSLNGDQAVESSDGRYRIVIAHNDPGVPNWLDPGGHPEGFILYRYQEAQTQPTPEVRVLRVDDLAEAMPADTPKVTPAQRLRSIQERRAHAARRWAP